MHRLTLRLISGGARAESRPRDAESLTSVMAPNAFTAARRVVCSGDAASGHTE